jgi:hypothetical protein
MILGNERGMHPNLDGGSALFADGQQLGGIAHFPAVLDVPGRQAGDALPVDPVNRHPGVKSQRRQDGQLVRRVKPLHVVARIGLGQPGGLGLPQRLLVGAAVLAHLGEDVVGGAVDDAHDASYLVGLQRVGDGWMTGIPPQTLASM